MVLFHLLFALFFFPFRCSGGRSTLWGSDDGDAWGGASSRVGDWSYAGPSTIIPTRQSNVFLSSFGADSTGTVDASPHIQLALDALQPGDALFMEEGVYRLDSPVFLRTAQVTVRGAGRGKTILQPTRSLYDVYGLGSCLAGTNKGYGWCKGFLELDMNGGLGILTSVTASASRGDMVLTVESTSAISAGDTVLVSQTDDSSQLFYKWLLDSLQPADGRTHQVRYPVIVQSVDSATQITLDRPLPFPLDISWGSINIRAPHAAKNIIMEDFTMVFSTLEGYPGHHQGFGFNAIDLRKAHEAVLQRLEIVNSDSAIFLQGSMSSLVKDVVLRSTRPLDNGGLCGHHGIDLTGASLGLVQECVFASAFVHDITVDGGAQNVITRSYFLKMSADHHGNSPFNNLWDNCITESLSRLYVSGGSAEALPHAGRWDLFWNVRMIVHFPNASAPPSGFTTKYVDALPPQEWPLIAIVPFTGSSTSAPAGYFLEDITPPLEPESLYDAQRVRRLGGTLLPPFSSPGMEQGGLCATMPDQGADPLCITGLVNEGACCAASCGQCGGTGCGGFPGGGSACCMGVVSTPPTPLCAESMPPCRMEQVPLHQSCSGPGLTCHEGVCCSTQSWCPGDYSSLSISSSTTGINNMEESGGMGPVIGGVVGGVCGLIAVVVGVLFLRRRLDNRKSGSRRKAPPPPVVGSRRRPPPPVAGSRRPPPPVGFRKPPRSFV